MKGFCVFVLIKFFNQSENWTSSGWDDFANLTELNSEEYKTNKILMLGLMLCYDGEDF